MSSENSWNHLGAASSSGAVSEAEWRLSDMKDRSPAPGAIDNPAVVHPAELGRCREPLPLDHFTSVLYGQRPITPQRPRPEPEAEANVCYSGAEVLPRADQATTAFEEVGGRIYRVTRELVCPSLTAATTPPQTETSVLEGFVREDT